MDKAAEVRKEEKKMRRKKEQGIQKEAGKETKTNEIHKGVQRRRDANEKTERHTTTAWHSSQFQCVP